MLSEQEKSVLFLLDELASSSLPLREQADLVTKTNEALQVLQDESEASELLGAAPSGQLPGSFVKLCRRRLVEAQKRSLANYEILRDTKTRQRLGEAGDDDVSPEPGTRDASDDMLAQNIHETKSESITKILQRIHGMAQGEVLKGELNISELEIGSKTLRDLQERYSAVDILLNGSKRLVKVLDEAEKWDRWCMLASLGFLAFVLVYIIYRRILSGPIKILLWGLFQLVGLARLVPVPRQPLSMEAAPSQAGAHNTPSSHSTYSTHSTQLAYSAPHASEVGEPADPSDAAAKVTELVDAAAQTLAQAENVNENLSTQLLRHEEL